MAMFDEKIYREPSMEEVMDGLEFDLLTHRGWVTGFYPDILSKNRELDEFDGDDEMKLAHAITRIKK